MPINLQKAKKGFKKRINVTIRRECKKTTLFENFYQTIIQNFYQNGGGRSTQFPKQMFVSYSPKNPLKHHKITKKNQPKLGIRKGVPKRGVGVRHLRKIPKKCRFFSLTP